jgi:hypothetical protein
VRLARQGLWGWFRLFPDAVKWVGKSAQIRKQRFCQRRETKNCAKLHTPPKRLDSASLAIYDSGQEWHDSTTSINLGLELAAMKHRQIGQ